MSSWLFPPFCFFFYSSVLLIFKLFIYLFSCSFFLSVSFKFSFLFSPPFFFFIFLFYLFIFDFLARHKRLVRTLLDQGFRYGLLCRKFKQFYRSHHSLIQCYSHSVTQHLREGVDSQVRWWRIHILLVGAAVTGTDRLSIYPFTGVPLAFSSLFF